MTRIIEKSAIPVHPYNKESSAAKTKSQGDSISDAKTLADILETLLIPNEIKDLIFTSMKYVIKRTKILNRRMTQLARFTRDQNVQQVHNF